MPYYLGIDTSNYTTSASIYDSDSGKMIMKKKLLPVKKGECGLRQSDAVFHHVQQLPQVTEELFAEFGGKITAVGVSSRPRNAEGSYMPCFTVGLGAAKIVSQTEKIPMYTFSHQDGHIAAALYSAGKTDLYGEKFIAFHVSGGTTECLYTEPGRENVFDITLAAKTLDLNAGQLIDRVGVMMGLKFPCGMELERLAAANTEKVNGLKISLKNADCCLSGIENICRRAYDNGRSEEYVSALCLAHIEETLIRMTGRVIAHYGEIPVVYAGGVMSDRIIKDGLKKELKRRYGYEPYFAEPEYSSDNASGIAYLCSLKHNIGTI